ncbi:glutathione S-transferase [Rhizobium tropici]|uniref:Glutathione S-transferase n=1 Tax=Rhizobium tropici TaxID=398 RepID=A0A5B0W9L2_RHITR|nr:glutathione S-transferase [Rhizobium tropici]KAA1183065.1 glutathione S-transferase [Rhizobium tropici]
MDKVLLTVYGMAISGHVHRVRLFLEILGLPYTYVETTAEDRSSPEYCAISPLCQVPCIRDGEITLSDSNAILVYLAERYAPEGNWILRDPLGAAHLQRWFSIAAGELRYGPALARAINLLQRPLDPEPPRALAAKLFGMIERHLSGRPYLAAEHPTLADIALYSYVSHAPEGGISLTPYPAVTVWLKRIEAIPGFIPLQWTNN